MMGHFNAPIGPYKTEHPANVVEQIDYILTTRPDIVTDVTVINEVNIV